jgi:hypothetical protein
MHRRSDDDFWSPASLEQLAREQGITRPQSLDRLIGAAEDLWDNDDDFERFLTTIDRHRREPGSA